MENTNEENINEITPTEINESNEDIINDLNTSTDAFTLKARGGDVRSPDAAQRPTDPVGLSRSILHVLGENPHAYCKINSVGPNALASAMAGFRLASIAYSARTKGTVLVCTQSEYTATVAGNRTRGVCTRVFPIPVNYQL